jgi:hypothetical protein
MVEMEQSKYLLKNYHDFPCDILPLYMFGVREKGFSKGIQTC